MVMKKLLVFLLVLMLMNCSACTEALTIIEQLDMRVYLSQTEFTDPQEVEVSIIVYNLSDDDRPGPLALYWPDGKMIEECGTPTLKAGERLEWTGTWFVTQEQIDAGRVIFAIQYTGYDGKGGTRVKVGSVAVNIISVTAEEDPLSPVLVLEGNGSTGYDWSWTIDNEAVVSIKREKVADTTYQIPDTVPPLGGDGKERITLNGLAPGEATITFSYKRAWEEVAPLYNLVYRVSVDEELNVTILSSSFEWNPAR